MTRTEKQIAQNRLAILNDLNGIVALAERQIVRVRGIPIVDNEDVADDVQGYADRAHEILQDLYDLRNSDYYNWEGVNIE